MTDTLTSLYRAVIAEPDEDTVRLAFADAAHAALARAVVAWAMGVEVRQYAVTS